MAARENQGYLIAVILLVLLSVILAIATYFGFSGMNEVADQRDAARQNYTAEQKSRDGFEAQAAILKAYLGMPGFSTSQVSTLMNQLDSSGETGLIDETRTITDLYNQDMSLYTSKQEGVDENYRGLLADVISANNEHHANTAVLNNNLLQAEDKLRTELAAKDKELAEKDKQLTQARNDLASERQNHDTTRQELGSKLDIAESAVKDASTKLSSAQAALETEKKRFADELAARDARITGLKLDIEDLTRTETDVADGQIVSVAPILGKVVINLGYADNLQPNQHFAVYDQQKTVFKNGEDKAKIEITRVLDAHLAEGRIIQANQINPILTRDFVVTSAWDPGYAVPIALVGIIDLDGDGQSDLDRLISIVEQNGGKVVAYHDEEGNVVGEIDENTRLFVKGDDPLGKMVDGYERLLKQRDRFQVREISVRELLNTIGYRSEARIQRFDDEAFVPRQPTTVTEGDAFDDGK